MLSRGALIYALTDPRSGEVKYIGQTRDLKKRVLAHIHQPCSKNMRAWIGELRASGLKPIPEVLETGLRGRRITNSREQYWIAYHREHGRQLLNADKSPGF